MGTLLDNPEIYDKEEAATRAAQADGSHDDVDLSDDERSAFDELTGGGGGLYTGGDKGKKDDESDGKKQTRKEKLAERAMATKPGQFAQRVKNRKKRVAIAAASAMPIILVLIIILLLGNLKVMHYYETMYAYNYARAGRTSNAASQEVLSTADELAAAEDAAYSTQKSRLGKIGETLDKVRPKKVIQNLEHEGQLKFNYTDTERFGGGTLGKLAPKRSVLTSVEVGGQTIPRPTPRLRDWISNPIDTYKENLAFKGSLKDALGTAMEEDYWWVRSSASKQIFERLGIKLRWFEKLTKSYKSAQKAEAKGERNQNNLDDLKETERAHERESASAGIDEPNLTKNTKKTAEETKDGVKICVEDDVCSPKLRDPDLPEEVSKPLSGAGDLTLFESALSKLGLIYGVALPVCLIFEGIDPNNVEKKIDATDAALTVIGTGFNSAVGQTLAGDGTARENAVIARKLSDTKTSTVDARNSGNTVTATQPGPETDLNGVYTLEGSILAKVLNSSFAQLLSKSKACDKITDVRAAAVLTLAEWAAIIASAGISGGAEAGAKEAADIGTAEVVDTVIKSEAEIFAEFLFKAGNEAAVEDIAMKAVQEEAKGSFFKTAMSDIFKHEKNKLTKIFSKKGALTIGGQTALVLLARAHVLAVLQGSHTGTDSQSTYVDNVDQGQAINSSAVQREMAFGRPLTEKEQFSEAYNDKVYLAQKEQRKSNFDRYLALDGVSLVSNLGVSANTSLTYLARHPDQIVGSVMRAFATTMKSFASVFINFGTPKVAMALNPSTVNPYHVLQFGWTQKELDYIGKPGYTIQENLTALGDSAAKVAEIYGDCWDAEKASTGKLLTKKESDGIFNTKAKYLERTKSGDIKPDKGLCAPNNMMPGADDPSDLPPGAVFRYRLSKLYENQAEQTVNFQSVTADKAGGSVGGSGDDTGNPDDPGSATGNAVLPSGTRQELVDRLLNSPYWKPQNSRVTDDVRNGTAQIGLIQLLVAIVEQAKVTISGSVIKTGHSACSASGYTSNHYSGLAIDIGNEEVAPQLIPWLYANRAALGIDELIFANMPAGTHTLKHGKDFTYDAGTLSGHHNHIHLDSANGTHQSAHCPKD